MVSFVSSVRRLGGVLVLASLLLGPVAADASAGLVASFEVGSGSSSSTLQFDFANGNSYIYTVFWDGATTGRDLFDIAAAAQPGFFVSDIVTFSFGDALFGQSIGGDTNAGFGTPPLFLDYWHYWIREDSAAAWQMAMTGFGDRLVTNGSWDGWVFGGDGPPSAIPAPAGVAVIGLILCRSRRRSR
jgi:hypothetical protein